MSRTPYAFFRGTRWMAPDIASVFKTEASSKVALVGDPHPENVSLHVDARTQQPRALQFNDFDMAGYGSYIDDLRRLAVGIWIIGDMGGLKRKIRERTVHATVEGYVAEVRSLAAGRAVGKATLPAALPNGFDAILVAGADDSSNGVPASTQEVALASRVLAAVAPEPAREPPPTIDSVTRRQAGVASFPLLRLQVVLSGPTAGALDKRPIEIKESVEHPARTIVEIEKQFGAVAAAERPYGWAAIDGREYRVRVIVGARRISADRLAKALKARQWSKTELSGLAVELGRLLAHGHCAAAGQDGVPGLRAIDAAITSPEHLGEETAAYAAQAAAANKADLRLFREALLQRGATLGWNAAP
jgi:uncharacterized protein (DUF2252 family)